MPDQCLDIRGHKKKINDQATPCTFGVAPPVTVAATCVSHVNTCIYAYTKSSVSHVKVLLGSKYPIFGFSLILIEESLNFYIDPGIISQMKGLKMEKLLSKILLL